MSEMQATLRVFDLQEYLNRLIEHGFDSWDNVVSMSENDMAIVGIKLGHRRRLQRENAHRLGHPSNEPLAHLQDTASQIGRQHTGADGTTQPGRSKPRYRRRPPRDHHAPTRPDTGYVAYAKFLRQDPQVANLPFVEISKHIGERWSSLSRDMKGFWNDNAAEHRVVYKAALAQYHKTEAYRIHCVGSDSKDPIKNRREAQVNLQVILPKNRLTNPENSVPSSIGNANKVENSMSPFEITPTAGSELVGSSPILSASITSIVDSTEFSPSYYRSSCASSVSKSAEEVQDVPIIESIWTMISQEEASNPAALPSQFSHDDLLSHAFQRSGLSRSFHIQTINPFTFQSREIIFPLIDGFLQNINTVYYLVNPHELWNHLDSALDTTLETSNLTMSKLCICLALGCQACSTSTLDMAIMWYENGRRYLDDHDWCLDPTVMQVLALISMFHMAQRPTTSSHYLDAAIRVGKADSLHQPTTQAGDSWDTKWLDIWNTMQTMQRILLLGCATDNSVQRISQRSPNDTAVLRYSSTRIQRTVATLAFDELSYILGCVQQQLGQSNTLPLWRGSPFVQRLRTWLYFLPDELSLPIIPGTERLDLFLMKDVLSDASGARKTELLHLHSLYFGVIGLLTIPSLQQIATTDASQRLSIAPEIESNAYECLSSALRLIDLCTTFSSVSPFPVYAWAPQCVLFTSSLACTLGVIWQRQVSARETSSSHEWLKRSNDSIRDTLAIFRHCARENDQAQRHYTVLQRIFGWLQSSTHNLDPEKFALTDFF